MNYFIVFSLPIQLWRALGECLASSQDQPTTEGQDTGINGAVGAGWLHRGMAKSCTSAASGFLQRCWSNPKADLDRVSSVLHQHQDFSRACKRTPRTVDSTSSPFFTKFLELDPLAGPEQGLCVCIDSRSFLDNGADGEKNVCILFRRGGWIYHVYRHRGRYCSS